MWLRCPKTGPPIRASCHSSVVDRRQGCVYPPLTVPPGQTRTFPPPAVQLPFDSSQAVQVHASVAVGATTLTADVPLKLTATGAAQQLKIELHADRKQWCARATDSH